jgi:WD40 repeat protein
VTAGKELKKMGPTPDYLVGVAVSRDGKTVATAGYASNVTVWDLAAGKPTWTHKIKDKNIAWCITFTPDGKAVVTGHLHNNCYVTPLAASGS